MGYRTSISTACLSGSLEDKLAAAAAARFHGVELAENDLVVSPWAPRRVRQECDRRGLTIDAYQPLTDVEAVPPGIFAANLRRAELTLAMLEQLGTRTLAVCSSMSPDAVDDDLAAEQLSALATAAERHGVRSARLGPVRRRLRPCRADRPARRAEQLLAPALPRGSTGFGAMIRLMVRGDLPTAGQVRLLEARWPRAWTTVRTHRRSPSPGWPSPAASA